MAENGRTAFGGRRTCQDLLKIVDHCSRKRSGTMLKLEQIRILDGDFGDMPSSVSGRDIPDDISSFLFRCYS